MPELTAFKDRAIARTRGEASLLIRKRFTIAVVMIVAVLLTFVTFTSQQFAMTRESVRLSNTVMTARSAQTMALERLASVRAFLITGDSNSLRRELDYRVRLPATLDTLELELGNDSESLALLQRAESALNEWVSGFAMPMLSLRRDQALVLSAEQLAGRTLFEPARAAFTALMDALNSRHAASVRNARNLVALELALIVIALVTVLLTLLRFRALILDKATALEEQQERLEEQAVELEQQQVELETSNEELANAATEAEEARDQAEDALRRLSLQAALLTSALDSSPLGLAFYAPDLTYMRVSKAITRMTGLPSDAYVGKRIADMHPDEAAATDERLLEVMRTGEPIVDVDIRAETRAHPGEKRSYMTSYFPIRTDTGELLGAGVLVADMSEQRRLEDELRQSQKMEAVGQLAGGIAHDFNNLLTVIVGHTEMLLSQVQDPVALDDAQQIQKAATQAASLTQKLLAFSRKQVLLPKVIDLNFVVRDVAPMLRRLIREDIEVEIRTADNLHPVRADPSQIEQVILNLTVNARDAMPQGGRLSIQTEEAVLDDNYIRTHSIDGNAGDYVVLSVSDTGVGMGEAVRKRAFEPFFTTKEMGKGTGLGLATVYGIVKQSGGHIWLYSEPGLGTTFKIYFPVHLGAVSKTDGAPQAPAKARGIETILLVEDDPAVLGLSKRVLEGLQYKVVTAVNGKNALDVFAANRGQIDLVMTDVVMPGMGGAELAKHLWSYDPEIPVVYMSGYTGDDMLDRGILDSDAVYLQKPFTTQALAAAVRAALERSAR